MEKRSWIDIIEYYKYGSNIHKIPFVSKFLCSIGRHDWYPVKLKNDVYVVMECIFCGERKTARMYEAEPKNKDPVVVPYDWRNY